jgi:eukaryotic-like serine/threonine-protein kinase
VRPDGTVKVLDFGLAKAMQPAAAAASGATMAMQVATITTPAMTQMGMILGTAAYMAPEQARGVAVDRRADLWAFGVIVWEMVTGTRLFDGPTVSDTLAAVLKSEPPWAALPPDLPAPVRRLLRRCLEKDRSRRLDSAAVARLELVDASAVTPEIDPPVAPRPSRIPVVADIAKTIGRMNAVSRSLRGLAR